MPASVAPGDGASTFVIEDPGARQRQRARGPSTVIALTRKRPLGANSLTQRVNVCSTVVRVASGAQCEHFAVVTVPTGGTTAPGRIPVARRRHVW